MDHLVVADVDAHMTTVRKDEVTRLQLVDAGLPVAGGLERIDHVIGGASACEAIAVADEARAIDAVRAGATPLVGDADHAVGGAEATAGCAAVRRIRAVVRMTVIVRVVRVVVLGVGAVVAPVVVIVRGVAGRAVRPVVSVVGIRRRCLLYTSDAADD